MTDLAPLTFDGRTPGIATLTLDRPEQRNSLSIELLDELIVRMEDLQEREEVRVLVLTGAGKCFCAGMDLKAVLGDPAAPGKLLGLLGDFLLALRRLPVVTVAKVNGAAIGGGCGLATVCDLAITHADSKMGFPEVDLGVCPAVVAPWLVRKVGAGRARRILLSGGTMSGQQAWDYGIVDHVVASREELDAGAAAIAERLASGGAGAMRATKDLLNQIDGSLDAALAQRSAELSARVLATEEAQATLRGKLGK
jgi:enoyl-CoA hydratase/carnithine racemase